MGKIAWLPSSACIWLFSSTHKTTAFSGGFKYSPTISRTFSTKNGSVDSLKCFCRCGCKPKACQIRCTVDLDMRLWDAICRTLQCVPSLGLVSSVLRTNCATRSSLIGRGRPGRNSSCRPATSCSRKRCRHLPTVALVNPNWRAISMFVFPEALSKIILARLTNPDGRERDLANDSNCSPCSAPNTNAAFGRPIAIGTSIVHKRCPCRQQYYCHLFMGHNTRCLRWFLSREDRVRCRGRLSPSKSPAKRSAGSDSDDGPLALTLQSDSLLSNTASHQSPCEALSDLPDIRGTLF